MKLNYSILTIVLTAIIFGNSCKKDNTPTGNTPSVTQEGTQLYKVCLIDTTIASPNDTISRTNYFFDASNRLTLFTMLEIKVNGDSNLLVTKKLEYLGTDTFSYRSTEYVKDFSLPISIYRDTTYLTISSGKRTIDSTRGSDGFYDVNKFIYNSTFIRRNRKYTSSGGTYNGGANIYQTKNNDNIVSQVDTLIMQNGSQTYYNKYEITASYLTNPSPFYKLAIPTKSEFLSEYDGAFGDAEQKNLISQRISKTTSWNSSGGTGTVNLQQNYSYNFRTDGLPTDASLTVINGGITKKYKLKYFYK